jgi:hypothetical protein
MDDFIARCKDFQDKAEPAILELTKLREKKAAELGEKHEAVYLLDKLLRSIDNTKFEVERSLFTLDADNTIEKLNQL